MKPDWSPFDVKTGNQIAPRPLGYGDINGIADRLRAAAFAEVQAEAGFLWAAENLLDAPVSLREEWIRLAKEERKHRDWLVNRMKELNIGIADRPVSDVLWHALTSCTSAKEFCTLIADAEERGRKAGARFREKMSGYDPVSAEIFGKIADEEIAHIELALKYASAFSQ